MRNLTRCAGAVVVALGLALAPKPALAQNPILTITDINVTDVQIIGSNSVLALVDVTGALNGRGFTLNDLPLPITLSQTANPDPLGCPILHLELEIERLDLLGLVVELNDCEEGPVVVDVTAVPGGLLGDLLCGLLGNLTLLNPLDAGILTGGLEDILNGIFDSLATQGAPSAQQSNDASPNACDILTLELGAISLNLLGLAVDTSDICLFVYAEPDNGVLGSLLCEVVHLFDSGGNQRAINALITNILRVISRRL